MEKILGLGNALVDVLVTLEDDNVLKEMGLTKGAMTLIDEDKLLKINDFFSKKETHLATGGSAGNAINALASLGAATGLIGKIGNDRYGDFFREKFQKRGTETFLLTSDTLPSGVASTFISADGERTFATHLGAAAALKAEELTLDMFRGYAYLFVEGYLVQDHDVILHAIELAFFLLLVNKYVDIVFANEEEAKAFTGKEGKEALDVIAGMCSIAVVKMGARGSLVRKGTETIVVDACKVDRVVDTTGAGDYFAAGFLYGLTSGYALERCARIASLVSGEVIQVIGAELPEEKWDVIKGKLELNN